MHGCVLLWWRQRVRTSIYRDTLRVPGVSPRYVKQPSSCVLASLGSVITFTDNAQVTGATVKMSSSGLRNCENGDCTIGSRAQYKVYTGGADPLRQSVTAHTSLHTRHCSSSVLRRTRALATISVINIHFFARPLHVQPPLGARAGCRGAENRSPRGCHRRISIAPSTAMRAERACPCFWSAFHSGDTGGT